MPIKRAKYYSYGTSTMCTEAKKFIEDAGILLDLRDLEKTPLNYHEIQDLIGHINLKHFLNPNSESYKKNKLDQNNLPREEVYKLMVEDYTLFKQPIIKTPRLMTVGCDKRKISEMLQLSMNGNNNSIPNGNTGIRETFSKPVPRDSHGKPTVRKTSETSSRK